MVNSVMNFKNKTISKIIIFKRIYFIFTIILNYGTACPNDPTNSKCLDCYDWCAANSVLCSSMPSVRKVCKVTCQECLQTDSDHIRTWSTWSRSTSCSKTCEGGIETFQRRCVGSSLSTNKCKGDSFKSQSCNTEPCSSWGEWKWTDCSSSCGKGLKNGTRSCYRPPGSLPCQGLSVSLVACQQEPCIKAKWVVDGNWAKCTKSCDGGLRVRKRRCKNGIPGDLGCPRNDLYEVEKCNLQPCINWSEWQYSACSVTCGNGTRQAKRTCPVKGSCKGENSKTEKCIQDACETISSWSTCSKLCDSGIQTRKIGKKIESKTCNTQPCLQWISWFKTACSVSCGQGTYIHVRKCPTKGHCIGSNLKRASCEKSPCTQKIKGKSQPWSKCSVTCGLGIQTRLFLGKTETKACNLQPCDQWEPWSPWSPCSQSCGKGERFAERRCYRDGLISEDCAGSYTKMESCEIKSCSYWTEWSQWTVCSVSCGGGLRLMKRECKGSESDANCEGPNEVSQTCNIQPCPKTWSKCSVTCGGGIKTVVGATYSETKTCNIQPCPTWSEWSSWSSCSSSCGTSGTQKSVRACESIDEVPCSGNSIKYQNCSRHDCPMWSSWENLGTCSKSCGKGVLTLKRVCKGGDIDECEGESLKIEPCNDVTCPTWSKWVTSECSVSCGTGFVKSRRRCLDENGETKGCLGSDIKLEVCKVGLCPQWSEWSEFSNCDVTCGEGKKIRSRTCVGSQSSNQCDGSSTDVQSCVTKNCHPCDSYFNSERYNSLCGIFTNIYQWCFSYKIFMERNCAYSCCVRKYQSFTSL